jgi:serine/threonine-protein kinase
VSPAQAEQVAAYARAFPRRGAEELAEYLVAQKVLTRFQAETALEGRASSLVLAGYTLAEVIGAGSMGTVYKARSAKDDNWYAVKIVPRRNVMSLSTIGEKVRAFKQVRHPRVSALMQIGASGDRVYLVWPFLEGGEKLDALVRRQGKLPPRQSAQVLLQVASGLQAYHEHGLFHGLLKPTDIVIGADRRVRVLDFGVGFLLTSERGKSLLDTMTNTKTLTRGLDCASPESILDPLDRTCAGDQYSLGCILYFCLTGQFPFPGANPVKKMVAHQTEEPTPIRDLSPDVPHKLCAVVSRLMRKAPEDRYDSLGDLVKELQKLTANPRELDGDSWSGPARAPAAAAPAPAPPAEEDEAEEEAAEPSQGLGALPWLVLAAGAAGGVAGTFIWLLARR